MPTLSICIPSNRNLEHSSQTLDNAYELSKNTVMEIVISDNSNDKEKKLQYENKNSTNFHYIISPHSNALENWRYALDAVTGKYISFLSDDDLLIQLPGIKQKTINIHKDAIGIRPHMAVYNDQQGIHNLNSFEICDMRAINRVKKYFAVHNGTNNTIFSFFKERIIRDYYSEFYELHPTRGNYTDWATVLGLISMGPLMKSNEFLYIYNNANWSTQSDINNNIKKTFSLANLPVETAQILPILNALDSFAAICRSSSPVTADEKLEAANYALSVYFKSFADFILRIDLVNQFFPENIKIAKGIISEVSTPVDILAACLLVVDIWLPGYAEKYQDYFKKILDKNIYCNL